MMERNCPKHVEFYSKDKFEKLVHLVGFIVRIYHDARSPERQIYHDARSPERQIYHDARSPERQIPCLMSALNFNYHVQFKAP